MALRQITLHFNNPTTSAEVTVEQVTEHFALAPVIRRDEQTGEAVGLTEYLNLVHIPTGATVLPWQHAENMTADENREFARIAQALPLDWDIAPVGNDTGFDPDGLFTKAFGDFLANRSGPTTTIRV